MKTLPKNIAEFVTNNSNCTRPIYRDKDLQLFEEYNFDT